MSDGPILREDSAPHTVSFVFVLLLLASFYSRSLLYITEEVYPY